MNRSDTVIKHATSLAVIASAATASGQGPSCLNTVDFAPGILQTSSIDVTDMSLGDLNGDAFLDVAVVNEGDGTVSTFLGNGDGTFTPDSSIFTGVPATTVHISRAPTGWPGEEHILLVGHDDDTAVIYTRNVLGGYVSYLCDDFVTDSRVTCMETFQFGASLQLVMLFGTSVPSGPDRLYLRVPIFPLTSDICDLAWNFGSFEIDEDPTDIAVGDFDGDGDQDVVVVTKATSNIQYFESADSSVLETPVPFAIGLAPSIAAAGDINEDGIDDLAVALESVPAIRILLGDGTGGFIDAGARIFSAPLSAVPTDMVIDDFNHDGSPDIVMALTGSVPLQFFAGFKNGAFDEGINLPIFSAHGVGADDANQDGNVDLIVSSPTVPANPFDGFYTFLSECTLCPADVNGDGSVDPADFTAWLACFSDPSSSPFCDNADVNNDGSLDPSDYTAWLAEFSEECP